MISKHLLPFTILPPATVVLPIEIDSGSPKLRNAKKLNEEGYREFATWMARAERIRKQKRGPKAEKQTVYERLDYQKELSGQDLEARHLVLYNAAGTNLAAAYVDRDTLILPLIVEHKLYWAACESQKEAHYLTAILNSEAANIAIKPFQSVGLMGERDIEKKVLDLPLPSYSTQIDEHRAIAKLGAEAHEAALALIKSPELPKSLAQRRAWIREKLKHHLDQINQLVVKVLGF